MLLDNRGVLLAEELLVLRMGVHLEGRVSAAAATGLVGALVSELLLAGRVGVRRRADLDEETLVVANESPLGDDLLDETLQALIAGAAGASANAGADQHRPSRTARLIGARARRRLRDTATVGETDLEHWWYGSWTCAEFSDLVSTLRVQMLVVQERLDRLLERVIDRLKVSGVLSGERGQTTMDATCYVLLRERLRRAVLGAGPPADARIAHLVALRSADSDWLVRDIGGDRRARRHARSQASAILEELPVAKAVHAIVDAHARMEGWWQDA